MVKISSVEVIFGKNIAYRVPYFSRMVVIINSGLTKKTMDTVHTKENSVYCHIDITVMGILSENL